MHDTDDIEAVMRYHERTKHHFDRYAPGPGELDWANQPDPFRRYEGAPLVRLPLLGTDDAPASPRYDDLYRRGSVPSMPVTLSPAANPGCSDATTSPATGTSTTSPMPTMAR